MARFFEAIRSIVAELGPAVLMVIAGIFFMILAFFDVSTSGISSNGAGLNAAAVFGAAIFVTGVAFLVFDRGDSPDDVKTVVFYAPTFQANSFFASLLDQAFILTKEHGYRLVVERGDAPPDRYHEAANYTDVIVRYATPNHVILMVPPNPDAYEDIWALPNVDDANLITLDMGFDEDDPRFENAGFHKQTILSNNNNGSALAAREVVQFCAEESIPEINLIVCEGSIHGRGQMFQDAISSPSVKGDLQITYLGQIEQLDFSKAVPLAKKYLSRVMTANAEELTRRPTFIFCANDNLTIGARMAASTFAALSTSELPTISLICWDASVFITLHIDHDDIYVWRTVNQRYPVIIQQAIQSADLLFQGGAPPKEITRIEPTIYKGAKS